MKRISIHCFTGFDKLDVYLVDADANTDEGIQCLKQGLTYEEAKQYIEILINNYNLSSNDFIRICNFDEEEYLTSTKKLTVREYREIY